MSKKKSQKQDQKLINQQKQKEKEKYRQLIIDLMDSLCVYDIEYEILPNNYSQKNPTHNNEFLKNPYMVRLYINDYYKDLYINDTGTCMFNGEDILDPIVFYYEYSKYLETKIHNLEQTKYND